MRDNVDFGLKTRKLPMAEVRVKVDNLLEVFGLARFPTRYPAWFSRG